MKLFRMKTFFWCKRSSISFYQIFSKCDIQVCISNDSDDEENLSITLCLLFWSVELSINTRLNYKPAELTEHQKLIHKALVDDAVSDSKKKNLEE